MSPLLIMVIKLALRDSRLLTTARTRFRFIATRRKFVDPLGGKKRCAFEAGKYSNHIHSELPFSFETLARQAEKRCSRWGHHQTYAFRVGKFELSAEDIIKIKIKQKLWPTEIYGYQLEPSIGIELTEISS